MSQTQVNPGQRCPECGAVLSAGGLAGLCPACLLKQGAAPDTATQPAARPFVPPPVANLVRLFPQFEIISLLGHGGMGAVYKARQPALDRFVALKILPAQNGTDAAFSDRFTREARALARLSHPNIVGVHEFGHVDGLHFFVMEFVDGVNLRQLQKTGRLSPREALQLVPQICDALQYAHDEGVVHRDIKPENVLVDRKGKVKIADFGLAKILGCEAEDLRLTGEGQVMGTPHYMAPEQVEHPLTVDHRADIFSLGVVFYEMLTGELPLGKFSPPSRKVQIDVRLDDVVLHALEKEPDRRYQQAKEVKTAVQHITTAQAGGSSASSERPAMVPLPRWATGVDFRSKLTLCGLPLLHVATGVEPGSGKRRIATGIIAIGDVARGVVAIGGIATGGLCFGGLALGLVSFGGLSVGLLALGGLALGLLAAIGGGAVAPIAIGGGAVGLWAYGGGAFGTHAMSGLGIDPRAWDFFEPWIDPLVEHAFTISLALPAIIILIAALIPAWVQSRSGPVFRTPGFWGRMAVALLCAGFCAAPLLFNKGGLRLPRLYLVTGRIFDSATGKPIAHAKISTDYPRTQTDAVGRFSVTVPSSASTIVIEASGYKSLATPLLTSEMGPKRHAQMEFNLSANGPPPWAPPFEPDKKPDLNRIREEANELRNQGQYAAALERYQWYWDHAREIDPSVSGVRLSFVVSDWVELGRRYPPAKQALRDIQARDLKEFAEGRGYFELFMEVSSVSQALQDEQATYELFKRIRGADPALAQQCFLVVQPLLIKHGEYNLCREYIGDPEKALDRMRQNRDMLRQSEQRWEEISKRTAAKIGNAYQPPQPPKLSDPRFVGEVCQLIQVLVKTGDKNAAEQIRDHALAVVNDARLQSAITDAEKEPMQP